MGGIHRVEVVRRHWDRAVDDPRCPGCVQAFLQAADRDRAGGEVDTGRRDLEEFGCPAAGPVQRLAEGPVPGTLAAGRREEGRPLLGVQLEPVSGGIVQTHFAHVNRMQEKCSEGKRLSAHCPEVVALFC